MNFAPSTKKPAAPERTEQKSTVPANKATRVESSNAEAMSTEEIPAMKIPAPKTPVIASTLNVEEVKIPSWLEPLARNAAAPVAPAEVEIPEDLVPVKATPTPSAPKRERERQREQERVHEDFAAPSDETERAAKPAAKSAAAAFGSHLLHEDVELAAANASRGGNKGLLVGAFAAVAVLAAGAYWYMRPKAPSSGNSVAATTEHGAEITSPAPVAAPRTQTATGNSKPQASRDTVASSTASVTPDAVAPGATSQQRQADTPTPVSALGRSKTVTETNVAEASLRLVQPAEPPKAEPQPKRPNLGEVRLATPKIKKGVRESAGAAPNLGVEGQALPSGDAFSNGLVSGNGNQPAAPPSAPIGGDVKPARLSVSQAPVYPAMARSQRVSGDVRVDALIDVNGRVSAMKVISGPAILHQAAMDALRHWKYVPAMLDGNPVPMHLTVTIQFRLQ
jgi:protein TonB